MKTIVDYIETFGVSIQDPKKIKCPFHKDKNPSSGIYLGKDGKHRFSCRVCGITEDYKGLYKMQEGRWPDNEERKVEKKQSFTIEQIENWNHKKRIYKYSDNYIILRVQKPNQNKQFLQFKRRGFDWEFGTPESTPLWGNPETAVLMVEGEKCVEALNYVGVSAVTTSGGAKALAKADLSPLKGKTIVLWPDNDKAGKEYSMEAKKLLENLGCKIGIMDLDLLALPEKGDSADFVANFLKDYTKAEIKKEIEGLILDVSIDSPSSKFKNTRLKDLRSGVLRSLDTSWTCLKESKWLTGGSVTLICAPPQAGKSWFVHNLTRQVKNNSKKVVNIQLEEDQNYHISRVLQMELGVNITDPDNITEDDLKVVEQNSKLIDEYAEIIKELDSEKITLTDIANRIEMEARAGADLIIVDPISIAEKTKSPWADDLIFVNRVKRIVKEFKTRLILVTHPKGGLGKEFSLDSLSGGTAYQRLAQNVIWLNPIKRDYYNYIPVDGVPENPMSGLANMSVIVLKARNANKGMYCPLFLFDFKDGYFNELGFHLKGDK